jgi:hypothetical protein
MGKKKIADRKPTRSPDGATAGGSPSRRSRKRGSYKKREKIDPKEQRKSSRQRGAAASKVIENSLLYAHLPELISREKTMCSAFGVHRRIKFPEFAFCSNCDEWDTFLYSNTLGQKKRSSYRNKCMCDHKPRRLFPSQRKVDYDEVAEEIRLGGVRCRKTPSPKKKNARRPVYADYSSSDDDEEDDLPRKRYKKKKKGTSINELMGGDSVAGTTGTALESSSERESCNNEGGGDDLMAESCTYVGGDDLMDDLPPPLTIDLDSDFEDEDGVLNYHEDYYVADDFADEKMGIAEATEAEGDGYTASSSTQEQISETLANFNLFTSAISNPVGSCDSNSSAVASSLSNDDVLNLQRQVMRLQNDLDQHHNTFKQTLDVLKLKDEELDKYKKLYSSSRQSAHYYKHKFQESKAEMKN